MQAHRALILSLVVALAGLGAAVAAIVASEPAGASNSGVAISTGVRHTCALTTGGRVMCWGNNGEGELGNGTTTGPESCFGDPCNSSPGTVTGLVSDVTAVSVGEDHSCALRVGGVKCWGANYNGRLGNTACSPVCSTPEDVTGLTSGVAAVTAGRSHTCALTTGGGVKCWGSNHYGQLGDGTTTNSSPPIDVIGLTSGVAAVSAGRFYTCAVTTAGGVKCWGSNSSGQLGNGTMTNSSTPVDVTGLTSGVTAVSAGAHHTCAVMTDGSVKCWGYNGLGQLGDGTITDSTTAVDVTGLTSGGAAVAAGGTHTCAVTTAGGVKCWGNNLYRQLGNGTATGPDMCPNFSPCGKTPGDVVGLTSGGAAVGAGDLHTCAITTAGGVRCWGWNRDGQLGNGTITGPEICFNGIACSNTPVDVAGLKKHADGDGCPDAQELQTAVGSETSGGRRDYLNPHDYMNPTYDGQNRIDDVLMVVQAYFDDDTDGNPGLPPYAPGYNPDTDRTALGPNVWNLGPPNGQQRIDDILAIIGQYFHDCG